MRLKVHTAIFFLLLILCPVVAVGAMINSSGVDDFNEWWQPEDPVVVSICNLGGTTPGLLSGDSDSKISFIDPNPVEAFSDDTGFSCKIMPLIQCFVDAGDGGYTFECIEGPTCPPIPVPGTLLLLSSGLIGFLALRRRR